MTFLVNEDSEVLSNEKWDLLLNLTGLEVCGLSNIPNCFFFFFTIILISST